MIQAAPYFLLAAAVAAGTAYVKGRHDGKEVAAVTALREERVAAQAASAAASAAAAAISQIRVQNTTIQQKVEREIQTRVEYRDCRHAPGVLDSVNEALTGRPNPAPGDRVPAADAAVR